MSDIERIFAITKDLGKIEERMNAKDASIKHLKKRIARVEQENDDCHKKLNYYYEHLCIDNGPRYCLRGGEIPIATDAINAERVGDVLEDRRNLHLQIKAMRETVSGEVVSLREDLARAERLDVKRCDTITELATAYDSLTEADTAVIGDQRRKIERLEARVEELEEKYDKLHAQKWDRVEGAHLITDDQIDAAWEKTESLRVNLQKLEQPEIERIICNTREELMREFNIHRCEDCIDGKFGTETCSTCNGKGRVIK